MADVSALQRLENLKSLSLDGSKVADINVLEGLENLNKLNLLKIELTDYRGVRGFDFSVTTGLEKLWNSRVSESYSYSAGGAQILMSPNAESLMKLSAPEQ